MMIRCNRIQIKQKKKTKNYCKFPKKKNEEILMNENMNSNQFGFGAGRFLTTFTALKL